MKTSKRFQEFESVKRNLNKKPQMSLFEDEALEDKEFQNLDEWINNLIKKELFDSPNFVDELLMEGWTTLSKTEFESVEYHVTYTEYNTIECNCVTILKLPENYQFNTASNSRIYNQLKRFVFKNHKHLKNETKQYK